MLLLALDTTTTVLSVALGDEEKLWAEYLLNVRKTHSQCLMPLIVSLFQDSGVKKEEVEGIAVAVGPGSFTGIRIGMATALGLSLGLGIPVVGVMTLDALAESLSYFSGLICPLLDARKEEFYTALYRGGGEGLEIIEPAAALSLEEICARLKAYREEIIFVGDGVESSRERLAAALGERYRDAPSALRLNRGGLVLQRGLKIWREKGPTPPYALSPFYIRLPEAEKRLLEKRQKGGDLCPWK